MEGVKPCAIRVETIVLRLEAIAIGLEQIVQ